VFFVGQLDIFVSWRELSGMFAVYKDDAMAAVHQKSRATAFHSLQMLLDATLQDIRPKTGIQHCSVYIPSITEVSGGMGVQESALLHAARRLRLDLHYSWPLTIILPLPILSRMQGVMRKFLCMMCGKWLVESWWKALIPRGALQKAPPNTSLSTEDMQKHEDIARAKHLCQQGIVRLLRTLNILARFYLSKLHNELWPRLLQGLSDSSPHASIHTAKTALEDTLTGIEKLLSMTADDVEMLLDKIMKCCSELRGALVLEHDGAALNSLLIAYRITEISFEDSLTANEVLAENLLNWRPQEFVVDTVMKDLLRDMEELQAAFI
jgi:hypothetical protein